MTERIPTRQGGRIAQFGQRIQERYRDFRSPEQRASRVMNGLLKDLSFDEEWTAARKHLASVSEEIIGRVESDGLFDYREWFLSADWIAQTIDWRRPSMGPDTVAITAVFIRTQRDFLERHGFGSNEALHYILEEAVILDMDRERALGRKEAKDLLERNNAEAGMVHQQKYRSLLGIRARLDQYKKLHLKKTPQPQS